MDARPLAAAVIPGLAVIPRLEDLGTLTSAAEARRAEARRFVLRARERSAGRATS